MYFIEKTIYFSYCLKILKTIIKIFFKNPYPKKVVSNKKRLRIKKINPNRKENFLT